MIASLDTLQVTKDLKAASFSEAQAEALARLLRERQEADLSQLATKADLDRIGAEIEQLATRGDLQALRADVTLQGTELRGEMAQLRADIVQLEQRLTIKLGGMIVVAVGAMAALAKLL